MGYLDVSAGQVIASAHMDLAVGQSIMRFTNTAQRDQQLPAGVVQVGMFCYILDVNLLMVYDSQIDGTGTLWRPVGALRMGYAQMAREPNGTDQIIAHDTHTFLKCLTTTVGGAGNRAGRATWDAAGWVSVPYPGVYSVTGRVVWPANNAGERRSYIMRYSGGAWVATGVAGGVAEANTGTVGSTVFRQQVAGSVYCAAGERIGLRVYQSSGGPITMNYRPGAPNDEFANLSITLLGSD